MIDGYHIISEQNSSLSSNNQQKNIINGRRIFPTNTPDINKNNNNSNHQSFSFSFGQKPHQQQKQFAQLRKKLQLKPQSNPIKRLRINRKANANDHKKHKPIHHRPQKKKRNKRNKNKNKKKQSLPTTEDSETEENEENVDSEISNGYENQLRLIRNTMIGNLISNNIQHTNDREHDTHLNSETGNSSSSSNSTSHTNTHTSTNVSLSNTSPSSNTTSSHSSSISNSNICASGRLSDNEYEMDYEQMSKIMYNSLNVSYDSIKDKLKWYPLKLWMRYNEEIEKHAEYAFAPMIKRIAGSCHELFIIYIKSGVENENENNNKPKIYQRLLKLARDPDEDNEHHFKTERHVSQYLTKMAICINRMFDTRTNICVWPVETVLFVYDPILFDEHRSTDDNHSSHTQSKNNKKLKWATVQAPFLPHPSTNNIFVKIEPNSGKPCVNDPCVNRYQHMFCAITKGLNIVRDWQGYGINQHIFLNVCKKFNVEEAVFQIPSVSYGVSFEERCAKNILIIIDPVLTTYGAHFENNNATDFGLRAMNEWKMQHKCSECRCSYFYLKDIEQCQFGFADPLQTFFHWSGSEVECAPGYVKKFIDKCRHELNVYGYCERDERVWVPPTDEEIENMDFSLKYERERKISDFSDLMDACVMEGISNMNLDVDNTESKDEEKNGGDCNGKSVHEREDISREVGNTEV